MAPQYFEIQAVAEGSDPLTFESARLLMREILTDYFQLKFHKEMKELPVYALTEAKDGPKFPETFPAWCEEHKGLSSTGQHNGASRTSLEGKPGSMTMCTANFAMTDFARSLWFELDRPVVDHTGLRASHGFELKWEDRSSLLAEVRERLGLQLVARREPVEVLVIDRVESPPAN